MPTNEDKEKITKEKITKELQDTQSKVDVRNIPISRVGIKDIKYPFKMSDRDGSIQSTIGNFSMSVGLPHDVKGCLLYTSPSPRD